MFESQCQIELGSSAQGVFAVSVNDKTLAILLLQNKPKDYRSGRHIVCLVPTFAS